MASTTNPRVSLEVLCLITSSQGILFLTLQALCVCSMASGFVFQWNSCVCKHVCLYIYVYFLHFVFGSFFFSLFGLLQSCLFLFSLIIFIFLSFLRCLFVFEGETQRVWIWMGREMGEIGGGENVIRIDYMKKLFSINK